MKKIILLFVALFGLTCCNDQNKKAIEEMRSQPKEEVKNNFAFNVDDEQACLNYVKGKTFYGTATYLKISNDGKCMLFDKISNKSFFESDFGKLPEISEHVGTTGRKVKVQGTTARQLGGAVEVQKDTTINFTLFNNGTVQIRSEIFTQENPTADPMD